MQRLFLPPEVFLDAPAVSLTDPDLLHQLSRVLRLQPGARVLLLDGLGAEHETELLAFSKSEIKGQILATHASHGEPQQFVTLFQALPKSPAKFEAICQHGTEVGISRFVPILTERTDVQGVRNPDRLARIIREAAEQAERGIVPELTESIHLTELLQNLPAGKNLIGDSFGTPILFNKLLPALKNESLINIFIGPEGGFSSDEINAAKSVGIEPFSLGKRILRAETAGVAVASALFFG